MQTEKVEELLEKYRKTPLDSLYWFSEISEGYREYAKFVSQNKIYFGIQGIDDLLGGIRPGEVCYIIASTNVGKSQIAFHILDYNKNNQNICIPFFSLENSEYQIYERIIQLRTGRNIFEIECNYANDNIDFINQCNQITKEYENVVNIIDRIGIDDIMPYIRAISELTELKTGLVIIDYAQLIKTNQSNEYIKISEISQKIKEISLKLKIPIIVLSQVSRMEAKDDKGLTLYSAKGSGEIENSAQILLSLEKMKEVNYSKYPKDICYEFEKGTLDILKLKIQKKKRGRFGEVYLTSNRHNLELKEFETLEKKKPDVSFPEPMFKEEKPF